MGRINIYIEIWGVFLVAACYHHILPYIIPVWYSQQHTFLENRVSCLPLFPLSTRHRVLRRETLQITFAELNWSRVIKEAVNGYRKKKQCLLVDFEILLSHEKKQCQWRSKKKGLSELCKVEEMRSTHRSSLDIANSLLRWSVSHFWAGFVRGPGNLQFFIFRAERNPSTLLYILI